MTDTQEAVDFLRVVTDAESTNRQEALEDLKFRFGEQWPVQLQQSRVLTDRPALTINETDSYCRQITNAMKQQRPRIKAHAVDSLADPKIANIVTGLMRHIEVNSNADYAYNLAGDFAVTMGFGYWRLRTDFVREDSFDQDIFIDPISNPFCVYFDPNSDLPDGSDAKKALITDKMPKASFRKEYPGAADEPFSARGSGDITAEWVTKEDVRVAEFFRVEEIKARLVALSNGTNLYEDELPALSVLRRANIEIIGTRESYKRVVRWQKQTAMEVLDKKDFPSRWIPVVPVYGVVLIIDGKKKRMGAVRFARDPQVMVNFWNTALTECVSQAPKAKWLGAEGQFDGHENEFARSNVNATAYLVYKPTTVEDKLAPPPQRIQPEGPPEGIMIGLQNASGGLQKIMGVFDPEVGKPSGNSKSGRAIKAEQGQSQQSNYHFYDNLTDSIRHTGRIALDLQRKVYDTERVIRIVKPDGRPDLITINQRDEAANTVHNDVTVGTYDVVMEVGPGYNTKREEALAMLSELMGTPLGEKITEVAGDLIVRLIDADGTEQIADRLAAANPLAQIDEHSDVPPKAQMMIKGLQQKLQQAMQMLQQAGIEIKFGLEKEKIKQEGETKRELMRTHVKAHDVETIAATKRHDTEVRAETALNVEELKGIVALLQKHIDGAHLQHEILAKEAEQQAEFSRDRSDSTIQ